MEDFLNALVLLCNYVIIPGIAYGAQLALGALGATLIYGILRFSNFAHGEMMAFGAMVTILVTWFLQSMGVGLGVLPTALLAIPFGALAAIAMALLTDKLVYQYFREERSASILMVIASVGVMFVMNGLTRFIIGPHDRQFTDGERFIIHAREFKKIMGLAEGLSIRMTQGVTLVIALIAVILLFHFLNKTRMGKAMRAFSDNEDLALLSGIDPNRVVMMTWVIAAVLATIAGVLYGLDKSFKPFTYFQLLLPVFAAAVVGGIGQPIGAVVGGFIIAFSEVAITYAYKKFLGYLLPSGWQPDALMQLLSTDYKFAISFMMLVIVLLIRPTGLFKGRLF